MDKNAGYQHLVTSINFVLFPIYFQKLSSSEALNSCPNDKILRLSKLKVLADDKINVTKKFVFGRVENIGKGKNAGYQHFLLFL